MHIPPTMTLMRRLDVGLHTQAWSSAEFWRRMSHAGKIMDGPEKEAPDRNAEIVRSVCRPHVEESCGALGRRREPTSCGHLFGRRRVAQPGSHDDDRCGRLFESSLWESHRGRWRVRILSIEVRSVQFVSDHTTRGKATKEVAAGQNVPYHALSPSDRGSPP